MRIKKTAKDKENVKKKTREKEKKKGNVFLSPERIAIDAHRGRIFG